MKVRSAKELQDLDQEIDLFDSDSWDFIPLGSLEGQNFEYFNDIQDRDFLKRNKLTVAKSFMGYSCAIFIMLFCCIWTIHYTGVLNDSDYKNAQKIQNPWSSSHSSYVDGVEVSSEELIEISKLLNNYMRVIKMEHDYTFLYDYCLNTSTFADTYYTNTAKIVDLFDSNDCYARGLRKFGGLCNVNRINKVIEKDGIYYCYASLNIPTTNDVYEYVYLYSKNMTKYFAKNDVTESNIVRYLIETMEENTMYCSVNEYCIKMKKTSTGFKIVDDSIITSQCIDSYTSAITQITNILRGSIATDIGG